MGQTSFARAVPLAILLLASAGPAVGQDALSNPVIDEVGIADPFLLKWNGEYYLYATGDPIRAYHSTDLVEWEEIGPVLSSSDAPEAWNQTDVWAPEVVYRNGTFYLYYTASRASDDWRVSEEARRVGVAVSRSPRGPFVDAGTPVTPGWGIDGHVFRDPDTGRDYLFYSYLYEPELPGAGLVVDSLMTPFRTGGAPAHVTRGTEPWEDKDGDPNNGSLRYTNEAPTVLARDGRYYMFYSGGSWDRSTYALAYAVSGEVMRGDGLQGPGWSKVTPPILQSTGLVQGPGHNSIELAPDNVSHVTAYHGRVVPFRSPGDRQTFVDRLYWHGDRPFLQPPTIGARSAPERPLFADRFDGPDGALGERWNVVTGRWRAEDGEAVGGGLALPNVGALDHYVFEANIRLPSGRGRAGATAWYADDRNRLDIVLDPDERAVVASGRVDGSSLPEVRTALAPDFRFDAYHQLIVVKNGRRLEVHLDGVPIQRHDLAVGPGLPGLIGEGGSPRFDGVAVTAHFRDTFAEPGTVWESRGGVWLVDEGAIHQVAGGPDRAVAVKGDPASDYEFTATLRWRDNLSVESRAGIAAAVDPDGRLVLAGFDRTIWPFARFHVAYIEGGVVARSLSVGLPRGFLYDVPHTIRVVKQGDGFTFFLDGSEIAAARFPIGVARPGLYTEGARAGFEEAAMTHSVVPRNLLLDGSFEAERWENGTGRPVTPWRLQGGAEIVRCCALDRAKRLVIPSAAGAAEQSVRLRPGRYTLLAWTTAHGAEPVIRVDPGSGSLRELPAGAGAWRRTEIDFEVAEGAPVTISITGRFGDAPASYVAVDNVYLVRAP